MQRKQKKTIPQLSIRNVIRSKKQVLFFAVLIFGLSIPLTSFSQSDSENSEYKTLLKNYNGKGLRLSTFYGEIAPRTAFTNFSEKATSFLQFEFGIHLNRKFAIGYYMASSPKTALITVPAQGTPEYQKWIDSGVKLDQLPPGQQFAYLYFHHSGLNINYMYKAHRVVFPRGGFKFGRGTLEMTAEQKHIFQFFRNSILKEKIWNLKPELGLGVNLRPWWRFHFDLGYQFVLDDDSEIISSGNFDGLTIEAGFGFGAFNR